MTIARACRPPTQEFARVVQAAGGLPSNLLVSRVGSSSQKTGLYLHPTEPQERENRPNVPLLLGFPPPPPPPRVTDATFYPLCGPLPDSINPAGPLDVGNEPPVYMAINHSAVVTVPRVPWLVCGAAVECGVAGRPEHVARNADRPRPN